MINKPLSNSQELKLVIIENFIDYFYHSDENRTCMKLTAYLYVEEDHVNELEQFEGQLKDKLI